MLLWVQHMAKPKHIGRNELLDPRSHRFGTWLNSSILGLVIYQIHVVLGSSYGWTQVYWVLTIHKTLLDFGSIIG